MWDTYFGHNYMMQYCVQQDKLQHNKNISKE